MPDGGGQTPDIFRSCLSIGISKDSIVFFYTQFQESDGKPVYLISELGIGEAGLIINDSDFIRVTGNRPIKDIPIGKV
jgi:hypothetical protein